MYLNIHHKFYLLLAQIKLAIIILLTLIIFFFSRSVEKFAQGN